MVRVRTSCGGAYLTEMGEQPVGVDRSVQVLRQGQCMRRNERLGATYFDEQIAWIDQAAVTGTRSSERRILDLLSWAVY